MARVELHKSIFITLLASIILVVCLITNGNGVDYDWCIPSSSHSGLECPKALHKPSEITSRRQSPGYSSAYDFQGASQDDPRLIQYIQKELLHPPSPHPYALLKPEEVHFSQFNQSRVAHQFLRGMREGFFLEVGASDGESLSNTLYFERELGWRGLLIEPLPGTFQQLQKKQRNAYSINVALSTSTNATMVTFRDSGGLGTSSQISEKGFPVKAIPLYSILLALDVHVIDFLSLDIEAFEVKILKTIPWDKVKCRLMCIEITHIPEGLSLLTNFLTSRGYKFLGLDKSEADAWYGLPELLSDERNTQELI